jgi:L-amino acid N-acyltransferase YncA
MKFRKATLKDIKRINEIYAEGILKEIMLQYPDYSKKKINEEVAFEIKEHRSTVKKNLQDKKQYWVILEEKDKVIGWGSAYIEKRKGVTESIYISKEFRRKGYGREMKKHLIAWLKSKKVKVIETNILAKNIPSLKLSESFGFEPYLIKLRMKK